MGMNEKAHTKLSAMCVIWKWKGIHINAYEYMYMYIIYYKYYIV